MDLEEQTVEQIGDRCEECGARLTPQEQKLALESGGRSLCTVHAAEAEPGLAVQDDQPQPGT
jgi:methionyl-tRNA synthetase